MLDPDSSPDPHCNADPQQCSKAKKKGKDGNTFGYQIPKEKAKHSLLQIQNKAS
jgi:hypothetical protein